MKSAILAVVAAMGIAGFVAPAHAEGPADNGQLPEYSASGEQGSHDTLMGQQQTGVAMPAANSQEQTNVSGGQGGPAASSAPSSAASATSSGLATVGGSSKASSRQ
jgi:hypothetical protein